VWGRNGREGTHGPRVVVVAKHLLLDLRVRPSAAGQPGHLARNGLRVEVPAEPAERLEPEVAVAATGQREVADQTHLAQSGDHVHGQRQQPLGSRVSALKTDFPRRHVTHGASEGLLTPGGGKEGERIEMWIPTVIR